MAGTVRRIRAAIDSSFEEVGCQTGRYRQKPAQVDAIKIEEILIAAGDDSALPVWIALALGEHPEADHGDGTSPRIEIIPHGITIHTEYGTMHAEPGDWLIRSVGGDLYPCKPDIFEATYEKLLDADAVELDALERRAW